MFHPQRVMIQKLGQDPAKVGPGLLTAPPQVGESLQMFLDDGKVMRTSTVTHVVRDEKEIVIDTRNSRYRLQLAS